MHRTRSVVAASVVLTLGISSFAVARNGDVVTQGTRNGTTTKETQIIANIGTTNANTGGFSTRQSNKSSTGGGATYGCRAEAAPANKPCLRANNLATGLAFEFQATKGATGGTITVGGGGDAAKPFTTNATGVADGLNADRVDGQNAADIVTAARANTKTRWLLVNEFGEIVAQSGGFRVLDAYATNDNVYIDSGEDLTDNGLAATIAVRNVEGSFGGEIAASRCQIAGAVECAPTSAKNNQAFVVAPRNSDGSGTTAQTRKRFYVVVTE
ncbi:MAG TPA: hypothetical protein VF533_11100 [Solirubrobacteraceae bacterium]|jgi:hypothetical protein